MEEGSGGLQGERLTAAEDFVENKTQQAVVGPLAPFEQQDLASAKAGSPNAPDAPLTEDSARDDVVPSLLRGADSGGGGLAVVLRSVGPERERVLVLPVRVVGAKDEKLCRAVPDTGREEHRHLVAIVSARLLRCAVPPSRT